jgi:DNA-binding NarL/FixJ family response regulator
VTRIAIIDPQPAVRAGLSVLLRAEPGLVPIGAASGIADGEMLLRRSRADVLLVEVRLLDGDGVSLCRRLRAAGDGPRVILYTAAEDPALALIARVAGADGLVAKTAPPSELFEAIRMVARGGCALPPVTRDQLDAAAHGVDTDDLALLAMLVDRTPPAEVAETLRMDRRRLASRIERLLGRLRRGARPIPA